MSGWCELRSSGLTFFAQLWSQGGTVLRGQLLAFSALLQCDLASESGKATVSCSIFHGAMRSRRQIFGTPFNIVCARDPGGKHWPVFMVVLMPNSGTELICVGLCLYGWLQVTAELGVIRAGECAHSERPDKCRISQHETKRTSSRGESRCFPNLWWGKKRGEPM